MTAFFCASISWRHLAFALSMQVWMTAQTMRATTRMMRPAMEPVVENEAWQQSLKTGASTSETIDMSLMRMFSAGPDVSLKGSPTVSPTTHAAWLSVFLPLPTPRAPFSQYFLALSQAPPALAMVMASMKPEVRAPTSRPARAAAPRMKPMMAGAKTAMMPG